MATASSVGSAAPTSPQAASSPTPPPQKKQTWGEYLLGGLVNQGVDRLADKGRGILKKAATDATRSLYTLHSLLESICEHLDENHEISYQTLVFPNPSITNSISVKLIGKKVSNPEIKIFDLVGNLVQTEKLTQSSMDLITIPLSSSLKNGNYILKIEDENNKVIVNESIVLKN